jgi:hypothetical protein
MAELARHSERELLGLLSDREYATLVALLRRIVVSDDEHCFTS